MVVLSPHVPVCLLFVVSSRTLPDVHSFPTRRSSDLVRAVEHRALVRRVHGHHAGSLFGRILDRKSTRLNSSHLGISYAVFCLKKKNKERSTWSGWLRVARRGRDRWVMLIDRARDRNG